MSTTLTNWAGNHTFRAEHIAQPATIDEVQDLVGRSGKVKAQGARHSFNDIADSTETLIALDGLPETFAVDSNAKTVTVNAGMTYARLGELLHHAGYAIHNMASLPHITVAGAIATATHGSGDGNGNLATAVAGLDVVTGEGERKTWTRESGDEFSGAVVNLGGLGVMVQVTLDIRPTFQARQAVYRNLDFDRLVGNFDAIMGGAYSASLFTDWQTPQINQVWLKQLHPASDSPVATWGDVLPDDFHGARLAQAAVHPSDRSPADSCTPQMGVPGPWHERLPHFRPEFVPASGNELQTEYFVPRAQAVEALAAVAGLRDVLQPVLIVTEVRTIAADGLWMSQAYGYDAVGIHFSWHNDWPAVSGLLPTIEETLAPFSPRPHWGKLFTLAPERLPDLYPKFDDFRALLNRYDPQGKFRNPFLEAIL